jgi:hypothetical protein
MKKITLLTALLILSTAVVNGVYDPNDTHTDTTGDGDMAITAHSGSSATAASGSVAADDGTAWRSEFAMTDRSQTTGSADTLTNVSLSDTDSDRRAVAFTGQIQVPTPCHTVDHDVTATDNGYVLTVTADEPADGQMCAQAVSTVTYSASFAAEAPATVTVTHGGTTVDTLEIPENNQTDEPVQQSVFASILALLAQVL